MAKPMPERRNSSRRVREQPTASIDIHHLVREQQQFGVLLQSGKLWAVGDRRGSKEVAADGQLIVIGRTVKDETVESGDFCRIIGGTSNIGAGGESLSLPDNKRRVHEEQSLLRDRGARAARAAGVGAGQIKDAVEVGQILAIDETVDTAAAGERRLGDL